MKKILSLLLVALFVIGLAACSGTDVIPQDIIDCVLNPEGEGCGELIPGDDRTAGEIAADLIENNWNGDLTFLSIMMENMDFEDSMEFSAEINLEVEAMEDGVLVTHALNGILIDKYQYLETGTLMHRLITVNTDGETMYSEVIYQEVDTGVIVYLNVADIKAKLAEDTPEVLDALDTVGMTEDWLMFRFDDTLANLIEIEVMKDMLFDIFFLEYGNSFFYDLQDEMELELGVGLLSSYGIDLGSIVQNIVDADYDAVQLAIDSIDYETLILDLDMVHLVPEVVLLLEEYQVELDAIGFNTAARIAYIQANGTEALLNDLNTAEISTLLDIIADAEMEEGDVDLSDMYDAYVDDELDHFMVMLFLNQPEEELMGLYEIPGFDFDLFKSAMDELDYDAFYLEEIDVELLADTVYEGQDAFDLYLVDLALTAPETASILMSFSGSVLELEPYMLYIDDVNYALDNISMFEDYVSLPYYLENEIVTLDLAQTPNNEILTTITLNGSETSQLFVDVMADAYLFLEGFETFDLPYVQHLNCPVGEECEDFTEYLEIIQDLGELGNVEMEALFNPLDQSEMEMTIDFTSLVNSLLAFDDENEAIVNDLSVIISMDENTTVTVPTEVSSVNEVAEDFAQVYLNDMAYEIVKDALEFYTENPLDFALGNHALDTYEGYVDVSLAFDEVKSLITVGGTSSLPTISLTLYWADGSLVFDQPISLSYLDDILNGDMPSAAQYQALLDGVNQDNFHMSKMIIIFLFSESDVYVEQLPEIPKY